MPEELFDLAALVSKSGSVIACELEGDAALLDLDTSTYYKLNPTGARLWNALEEPRQVSFLVRLLEETYGIDGETGKRDVERLLSQLSKARLVTVSGN